MQPPGEVPQLVGGVQSRVDVGARIGDRPVGHAGLHCGERRVDRAVVHEIGHDRYTARLRGDSGQPLAVPIEELQDLGTTVPCLLGQRRAQPRGGPGHQDMTTDARLIMDTSGIHVYGFDHSIIICID
jgi:hypothetical protein